MLTSDGINLTFEGQPATLRILRHDGCCWARIVTATGEALDVQPKWDIYDYEDGEAFEFLKRYIRRLGRKGTAAALGWTA